MFIVNNAVLMGFEREFHWMLMGIYLEYVGNNNEYMGFT
jgi:hypothetical protein